MKRQTLWTYDFTVITIGSFVSLVGNALSNFALSLLVLDYTGSTFLYMLFQVSFQLPIMVCPVLAGPYLDRVSRKKVICALDFLSAGIFFLLFLLLRGVCRDEVTEIPVPDPPREEEKPTGNAELDKMISDGRKAVSEMKRLDDAIEDEKISADIRRLETICQQIFQQVKADPAKLPQIRRFMDYYLPTTLKLLNAYDRMDATGVAGENITGTKERVESIMGTIVTAFEKQLDTLFGADAMDISTDISVLETMLAREGLAGERMEAQTTKNADGTDIKLEL